MCSSDLKDHIREIFEEDDPVGDWIGFGMSTTSGVFFVFLLARFACVCPRLAICICLESGSKDQLYQLSISVYKI